MKQAGFWLLVLGTTKKLVPVRRDYLLAVLIMCCTLAASAQVHAGGSVVRINHTDKGYRLVRNDELYFIKGVGFIADRDASYLDQLVTAGSNSLQTWGVDQVGTELLDQTRGHV